MQTPPDAAVAATAPEQGRDNTFMARHDAGMPVHVGADAGSAPGNAAVGQLDIAQFLAESRRSSSSSSPQPTGTSSLTSNGSLPNLCGAMSAHVLQPTGSAPSCQAEDELPPALFYISATPMDRTVWFGKSALDCSTQQPPPIQSAASLTASGVHGSASSRKPSVPSLAPRAGDSQPSAAVKHTDIMPQAGRASVHASSTVQSVPNSSHSIAGKPFEAQQSHAIDAALETKLAKQKMLTEKLRLKTAEAVQAVAGQPVPTTASVPMQYSLARPSKSAKAPAHPKTAAEAKAPKYPWIWDDLIDTVRPGACTAMFDRRAARLRQLGVPEALLVNPRTAVVGLTAVTKQAVNGYLNAAGVRPKQLTVSSSKFIVVCHSTMDAIKLTFAFKSVSASLGSQSIACYGWSGPYFSGIPTRCRGLENNHQFLIEDLTAIAAASLPALKIDAEAILRAGSGPLIFPDRGPIPVSRPSGPIAIPAADCPAAGQSEPSRADRQTAEQSLSKPMPDLSGVPAVASRSLYSDSVVKTSSSSTVMYESISTRSKRMADDERQTSSKRTQGSHSPSRSASRLRVSESSHDRCDDRHAEREAPRCVILRNAYDPELETLPDWRHELGRELRTEACDSGRCESVYIPGTSDGAVVVFFERESEARHFSDTCHGRWFGGRKLCARTATSRFAREHYPDAGSLASQ